MPSTLEQTQFGFDRDSRRTWQRRPLTDTQDLHHDYDALSQVTQSARGSLNLNLTAISATPAYAESWDYDPTGNWRGYRTAANGASPINQQRVHDRGNRLTQIEDSTWPTILDRVGRIRQSAPDATGGLSGKLELEWDAWSRITRVKNNGSTVGDYTYDGLTRRTTREVSGVTLHSYYSDAWRPLEERKNAETTPAMSYLWGARHRDDLVRRDRAVGGTTLNETRYVLMDYFNASAIADEEGEVTERYAYSAFGIRSILNPDYSVRTSSECGFEFGFQGQFLDIESGMMNYGYRSYSPYLGRWTCKDPIGIRGGLNLYANIKNGTVNRVDYLGLKTLIRMGPQSLQGGGSPWHNFPVTPPAIPVRPYFPPKPYVPPRSPLPTPSQPIPVVPPPSPTTDPQPPTNQPNPWPYPPPNPAPWPDSMLDPSPIPDYPYDPIPMDPDPPDPVWPPREDLPEDDRKDCYLANQEMIAPETYQCEYKCLGVKGVTAEFSYPPCGSECPDTMTIHH